MARTRALNAERRRLHNELQDAKGSIRLFVRVRPLLASDVDAAADDGLFVH